MCAICGIASHVPETSEQAVAPADRTRFAAFRSPNSRTYIGGASLSMAGDSIGVVGGLIGIHWSLAVSAITLAVLAAGLLAYTSRATSAYTRLAQRYA